MVRQLSKVDAAASYGVSVSTIDRRIAREELTVERDTPRGKVWVFVDGQEDVPSEANSPSREEPSATEVALLRQKIQNLERVLEERK